MARGTPSATDPLERWRALHGTHERVVAALDRTLAREHQLSSCEVDVLQRIAGEPDGLRIQDLSERVLRSHSAMSRLVGRLERDRLVTRATDPGDRRGVAVRLTDRGRDRLRAAEATQRRVLVEKLPAD